MRYRINEQLVLMCMPKDGPKGPLAPHLPSFARFLSQQGYAESYVRRHLMIAACFSRWLERRRIRAGCINGEHASKYLRSRYQDRKANTGDSPVFSQLMEFLRGERVISGAKTSAPLLPAERCARGYQQYLREGRGLVKGTIINYVPFITDFLKDRFGAGAVRLSVLKPADVVRFVQSRARCMHPTRRKHMTIALRSFFRYARLHGKVTLDLAAAVPTVASWSMASIPRAIAPQQTRRLLAGIDRRTAVGRRDYAIVLLLARLGLRACEVASLELSDINWRAGQLSVRGKGRHGEMPLPVDVGKAIAAYLRHGRPQCSCRRVFMRSKAPVRGFTGSSAVGYIVRNHLERAGIRAPTYGSHQFRHGLASDMLRRGASLAEIGAVLGHRHPDTTRIYTKIDLKALQTIAQPWPGGVG